jgi:hypothetical protein
MKTRDIEEPGAIDLDRLRQLAGISLGSGAKVAGGDSPLTHGGNEKGEYMRKHKVEPGTDAWFKLWFARPQLTGENPYGTDTFGGPNPSTAKR